MCESDEMRPDSRIFEGALSEDILTIEEELDDASEEFESREETREEMVRDQANSAIHGHETSSIRRNCTGIRKTDRVTVCSTNAIQFSHK